MILRKKTYKNIAKTNILGYDVKIYFDLSRNFHSFIFEMVYIDFKRLQKLSFDMNKVKVIGDIPPKTKPNFHIKFIFDSNYLPIFYNKKSNVIFTYEVKNKTKKLFTETVFLKENKEE